MKAKIETVSPSDFSWHLRKAIPSQDGWNLNYKQPFIHFHFHANEEFFNALMIPGQEEKKIKKSQLQDVF